MDIACPEGWKRDGTLALGAATLTVRTTVQIYASICDSCDLCGITHCRFYDTSPAATRRFMQAQGEEHTLDHLLRRLRPN